ncbi:Hypothetical protein SAMN02745163_03744 [Clostridium cavendishii DSM 21758]|uniref:DUF2513 domain-containing protein n=1 Tax=Clostridium cavendishii DSM 21758 TaxID=1121302 RepID=A0A1M6S482_9CLOT|nr:DUF2513 domain-containing protein [Clostridium cavendishii]SHK39328.1 Hypothetical protein SAMN02745163_03744 [Clostridium cavendishii DSM 21758]
MKLNPDCIRDILLTVEENTDFSTSMSYNENSSYDKLNKYSQEEIFYHINQCELSGLVTKVEWILGGSFYVRDLSPSGHEFLSNIRSDTNWSKTKEVATKVGSFSLDILSKVAVSVATSLINKHI